MKFRKSLIKYLLILMTLYFISLPFIHMNFIRVIVIIPLSFVPFVSLLSYQRTKESLYAREQLKSLLENMCTKVSAGKSIETVFLESRQHLLTIYGKDAIICKALRTFEDKISSGVPYSEAIIVLAESIPCPEAQPLFYVISGTRHLGNKILQVLRHSLFMVGELLMVSKDISSDVSQKRLESTVMSVMPFAVLWSLDTTSKSYLEPAFKTPLGNVLMLFAFILSVLSYCLGAYIISNSLFNAPSKKPKTQNFTLNMAISNFYVRYVYPSALLNKCLTDAISVLPDEYTLSIYRTLKYLYPNKKNVLEEYFFIKLSSILLLLISYLMIKNFIDISLLYFSAFLVLITVLQDIDIKNIATRNKSFMLQDFPTFIGLISTLLNNGIVLSKALSLCFDTFSNASNPFRNELFILRASLASGTPAYEVVEAFAIRCQIPEVSCALQLAAAYDRTGNSENLNLLKLQSSTCFAQSKLASRRLLDESSVKLLIPMVLQLICVIIITVVPSLLSLKI